MPRIQDLILDCVIYLYPSAGDADAGVAAGGTGFLASVQSEVKSDVAYVYAVTNSHVIREGHSPVIRMNTQAGDKEILVASEVQWVDHPAGDDVAILALGGLDAGRQKFSLVPLQLFLTHELVAEHEFGPGDDTFMVGRFVNHEGKQRNLPTVRFGNISMMPIEPIRTTRGLLQESFLVETRSLGGYSGSPVFVFAANGSMRPKDRIAGGGMVLRGEIGPYLLGIDYGHLPITEKVVERDKTTPVREEWVVQSNSGQMAVVPAWRILSAINGQPFKAQRDENEVRLAQEQRTKSSIDVSPTVPEHARRADPMKK